MPGFQFIATRIDPALTKEKARRVERKIRLMVGLAALAAALPLNAVPPLVSGDVPTAEKESFELYLGVLYESEETSRTRQFPADELVYGISDRQEITLELPYLSQDGQHGFGDVVVGTKYMILKETK